MTRSQIHDAIKKGAQSVGCEVTEIGKIEDPQLGDGEERLRVFYKRPSEHSDILMIKVSRRSSADRIARSVAAKIRKQEQVESGLPATR